MEEELDKYEEQFLNQALKAKKVKTDSGEVEQQTVTEQIKALEQIEKMKYKRRGVMARFGFYKTRNLD